MTSKTKRQALNDFTARLLSSPVKDYVASIVLSSLRHAAPGKGDLSPGRDRSVGRRCQQGAKGTGLEAKGHVWRVGVMVDADITLLRGEYNL